MAYIGKTPTPAPLTSSDITDGIITTAKIVDANITTAKIADDAVTTDKLANSINSAITANTAKTGITSSQASAIIANTAKVTNATHSGEVTGATALTIANNIVDEANLKVSNSPTNGYVLSAQSGNTGGLTWVEAGGGAFNLLSTTTVSSAAAAIDITSNIDSTYRNYMIIGSNIHISQDELPILMRVFSADGSPDTSSNCFHFVGVGRHSSGSALTKQSGGGNNQAEVNITQQGNAANETSNFVIHMFNPSGTTHLKMFHGLSTMQTSDDKLATGDMSYMYRKTIAITGVRFFVTGGTIETGVFKLYGIS